MIGRSGERGSGISVLGAHDDDDDDVCIVIWFQVFQSNTNNLHKYSLSNCFYLIIVICLDSYMVSNKLATIVEGDPKTPFSIATTPRCRGGHYSILWFAALYP